MTSCCCNKLSPSRLLSRTDTSPMVGAHPIARILNGFWCCAQLCSAQRGAKRCPVPWSVLLELWGPPAAPCRAHPMGYSHLGAWRGHALASCWKKKAAWKGRRAKPRGDTSLSCPAGSQKAAAEMKPTARSSCPGKEACSPYQQLRRLRQQTSCPRPSWRGSKMQSSALSPFSPSRFMTSA